MNSRFLEIINASGQSYRIERDGELIGEFKGMEDLAKGQTTILYYEEADVQAKDFLISQADVRLFVKNVLKPLKGKPNAPFQAQCLTQHEYSATSPQPQINITNAYGSTIATQGNITINYNSCIDEMKERINQSASTDKEELNEIVLLLEQILSEKEKPTRGMLARFSDVMERNSWISGSIATTLLTWAMMPR